MKKGQFAIFTILVIVFGIGISYLVYTKLDNVEKNKVEGKEENKNSQDKTLPKANISKIEAILDNSKYQNGYEFNEYKLTISLSKPKEIGNINGWELYSECIQACKFGELVNGKKYDPIYTSNNINSLIYTNMVDSIDYDNGNYIARFYSEKDGIKTYGEWSDKYQFDLNNLLSESESVKELLDLVPKSAYSGKYENKKGTNTKYYPHTFNAIMRNKNGELVIEETALVIANYEDGSTIVRKTVDGENITSLDMWRENNKIYVSDNGKTIETNTNDYDYALHIILKNYESEAYIFKHTFKKNSNGKYYWYSTEKIN